jgi:hypothetical protein
VAAGAAPAGRRLAGAGRAPGRRGRPGRARAPAPQVRPGCAPGMQVQRPGSPRRAGRRARVPRQRRHGRLVQHHGWVGQPDAKKQVTGLCTGFSCSMPEHGIAGHGHVYVVHGGMRSAAGGGRPACVLCCAGKALSWPWPRVAARVRASPESVAAAHVAALRAGDCRGAAALELHQRGGAGASGGAPAPGGRPRAPAGLGDQSASRTGDGGAGGEDAGGAGEERGATGRGDAAREDGGRAAGAARLQDALLGCAPVRARHRPSLFRGAAVEGGGCARARTRPWPSLLLRGARTHRRLCRRCISAAHGLPTTADAARTPCRARCGASARARCGRSLGARLSAPAPIRRAWAQAVLGAAALPTQRRQVQAVAVQRRAGAPPGAGGCVAFLVYDLCMRDSGCWLVRGVAEARG